MTEKSKDSFLNWLVIGAGLVCCAVYLFLAQESFRPNGASLIGVGTAFLSVSLLTLCLFALFRYRATPISAHCVLLFALLFRLIGAFGDPILEDDHYRYLWDGWMTLNQGTPYNSPPSDWFASAQVPEQLEFVLDGINYPDVPTVYGPTAQLFFAASALLMPGSLIPLKVFIVVADCLVLLLLARLATTPWLLLYGWSFLLVKEFAFTAHVDALGASLLFITFCLRQRMGLASNTVLSVAVGALLAAALGVKVICLVAVPFLLQTDWRSWLAFTLTMLLLGLPFGFVSAWLPGGLIAMSAGGVFNAPVYLLAMNAFPGIDLVLVKTLCVTLLAIICLLVGQRYLLLPYLARGNLTDAALFRAPAILPRDYLNGLNTLWCAQLLLSPVLNPWYLVWWLPFACLKPSRVAWVASFLLALSYISGINLNDTSLQAYEQPYWVLLLEFVPIFLAFLWDLKRPLAQVR